MTVDNKTLIQRWFEEVWNQGRVETIEELLAEECVIHGLADASGKELRGPAEFRAFHAQFREAFPEMTVTVDTRLLKATSWRRAVPSAVNIAAIV
ncbi:MAG: hypothetical protein QOE77_3462 [Blastocatellia bacterium]|jgi:hypothetical protein|nr:hypothetical protein [Blastocatellia bacterium]